LRSRVLSNQRAIATVSILNLYMAAYGYQTWINIGSEWLNIG
jgi:hypothetical protein